MVDITSLPNLITIEQEKINKSKFLSLFLYLAQSNILPSTILKKNLFYKSSLKYVFFKSNWEEISESLVIISLIIANKKEKS